jgi:hypothetical protein
VKDEVAPEEYDSIVLFHPERALYIVIILVLSGIIAFKWINARINFECYEQTKDLRCWPLPEGVEK